MRTSLSRALRGCQRRPSPSLSFCLCLEWWSKKWKQIVDSTNQPDLITDTVCLSVCLCACVHPDYSHHQQQQQQHQSKVIQQQQPAQNPNLPVIDCKLSPWSPWSTCSALCGEGKRTRSRYIVQMPQNGGKPCDKKLSRTQKCKDLPPCPPIYPLTTTLIKTPSPPIATTTAY